MTAQRHDGPGLTMPFRFRRSIRIAPGVRLNLGRRGPIRFRHSIRLAPGIRLNIGKRGLSTSLGGRGAHVTVGRNTTRATVSAPGTGLSCTLIWGARLLGAAVMMALLFLLAAGWL
jgi:hypothetical protein